jgi:hypothetical protein
MGNRLKREINHRELGEAWSDWDGVSDENAIEGSSALYILFSILGYLVLAAAAFFAFYMISPRLMVWSPLLERRLFVLLAAILTGGAIVLLLTFLTAWSGLDFLLLIPNKFKKIFRLIPLSLGKGVGRILGYSEDLISASFISFNNRLVAGSCGREICRRLLVILPRCLQRFDCKQDIITDVANCKSCGGCDIASLVDIMEKRRFRMTAVSGGRLARKIIADFNPTAVIAVACERELLKGLSDIANVPVIAIPNKRPQGPCKNTVVNMDEFRSALNLLSSR